MTERHERHDGPTRASQLEELLACERELAELLGEARDDARRRVEEARGLAARAEADLQEALEREAAQERASIREGVEARLQEISGTARERAASLEAISDDRVEHLAEAAFRRLIEVRSVP